MKYRYLVLISILISCSELKGSPKFEVVKEQVATLKISPEEIIKIDTYSKKARDSGMYLVKYQIYLDSALMIKPDSAYLWQQKAMPLYKARKYSVGKPFLENAVNYNLKDNLDYSGFMKFIPTKYFIV